MIRYPSWIPKLEKEERFRAKAIYAFLFMQQPSVTASSVQKEFDKLVDAAKWPEDGTLPPVTPKTAKRLGINTEEWDEWKKFSQLRSLSRQAHTSKKKLLSS